MRVLSTMLRTLVLALLVAVGVSTQSHADGGIGVDGDLKACKGLPSHGKAEPVSEDVLYFPAGPSLAFPRLEGGLGCEVYALARPTAQALGHFGGATAAIAVTAARCSSESCPVIVAVRGKGAKPLAAVRTDVNCDQGVALRPLQLFVGRDDLELVCRFSAGAGWNEEHLLIDTSGGQLTPFYVVGTGSYQALSVTEKKAGAKPWCPVGSLRVEKIGDDKTKPLLRLVDPSAADASKLHDGRGTLPAQQLVVDIAHHDVKPTGVADVPTQVDAHRGCR